MTIWKCIWYYILISWLRRDIENRCLWDRPGCQSQPLVILDRLSNPLKPQFLFFRWIQWLFAWLVTIVDWTVTLKKYVSTFQSPEYVNVTLFGKEVFVEVIDLRILRQTDHPGWSRYVLNLMISVLIMHVQRRSQTEGRQWEYIDRDWSDGPKKPATTRNQKHHRIYSPLGPL